MKSWYWRRNAWKPDSFLAPASLLGPWVRSRSAASPALRPRSGSTSSCWVTARASIPYQEGRGRVVWASSVVAASLNQAPLDPVPTTASSLGRIITRSLRGDGSPRQPSRQWADRPTFTETTAIATASAMRPSTSDRSRLAPAAREATNAVTPIMAASRNPAASRAGPSDRKKNGHGDDEGHGRGGRELRPDRPAGPRGDASPGEQPGREVEREHVGEGHADRGAPDHRHRRGLVDRVFLDGHELGRQDDAHVQGHRDGLANGLARGRAAPRS